VYEFRILWNGKVQSLSVLPPKTKQKFLLPFPDSAYDIAYIVPNIHQIKQSGVFLIISMGWSAIWSYVVYAIFRKTKPNLLWMDSYQIVQHLIDFDAEMLMHVKLCQIKLV
jgi:hypothetical protein